MTALAHRLNDRLQIQRAIQSEDVAEGAYEVEYKDLSKVWGEIHELSDREILSGRAVGDTSTVRITVRWTDQIEKDMHLLTLNDSAPVRRFRVNALKPGGRREYLELRCEEIEELPEG